MTETEGKPFWRLINSQKEDTTEVSLLQLLTDRITGPLYIGGF